MLIPDVVLLGTFFPFSFFPKFDLILIFLFDASSNMREREREREREIKRWIERAAMREREV
jgi:hypothetical protein